MKALSPQPAKGDLAWQGHDSGVLMMCHGLSMTTSRDYVAWLPSAEPGPDPAVLAQQAVEYMRIAPIRVGLVPLPLEKNQDSVGIVGQQVWMWVDNPTPDTYGPITKSATAGDYTVTATGRVDKIVWTMGDGKHVTCRNPGTVWVKARGANNDKSPTCGYMYDKQGTYPITATSYWIITWNGMGQNGTINLTRQASVRMVVGELQVLVRANN